VTLVRGFLKVHVIIILLNDCTIKVTIKISNYEDPAVYLHWIPWSCDSDFFFIKIRIIWVHKLFLFWFFVTRSKLVFYVYHVRRERGYNTYRKRGDMS